jgi:hypothetical protein
MSMRRRFHRSSFLSLTLFVLGCQKENPEPGASNVRPPSASPTPQPAHEVAAASASARPPAAEMPFVGQELKVGNFIETSAYKFRVDGVVRCADAGASEKVPDDRRVRVAAKVAVFSKYDEFFLSAQDITLEKEGVILNSELGAKTGAECAPLLEQKHLKHDQTAKGFVIFQVPNEAFVRGATVAFEPTRWGGAPRTEVVVAAKDFAGKESASPPAK